MAPIDDPRCDEDAERALVAHDMELKASRVVEGAAPIRSDLGADAVLAEQGECSPRGRAAPEIEVEPPLPASTEMEVPSRVEESRDLGAAVASTDGGDARELLADVLRRDQSDTPSRASRRRLTATPAEP